MPYIGLYNGMNYPPSAGVYDIGVATSPDRLTWTKNAANPVVVHSETYDIGSATIPNLVYVGGTYYGYYSAYSNESKYRVALVTSTDGTTWTKQGVVLDVGAAATWDANHVLQPVVLYEAGEANPAKKWKMWYIGQPNASIGYAYSPDGITWTKYASNPKAIPGGGWDPNFLAPTAIYKEGATYYLFCCGGDGTYRRTGVISFTNPEGTYTKYAGNPVLARRTNSQTQLTAPAAAGQKVLTVAATANLLADEPVLVWYNGGNNDTKDEPARIKTIDSATQVTLYDNLQNSYAINDYVTSYAKMQNSMMTVYKDGTTYRAIVTVWNFSGKPREYACWASANAILGAWSWDFSRGVPITGNDSANAWDRTSCENLSFVEYTITKVPGASMLLGLG